MQLNVGCGPDYKQGWVNIDTTPNPTFPVDVQAAAYDLPYDDDTVERIYAGHVLEHLPLYQVPLALREFRRVLRPGGQLCIVGPDVDRLTDNDAQEIWERTYFGTQRYAGDFHYWACSERIMGYLLTHVGWWDYQTLQLAGGTPLVREWRITGPDITAQFCLLCTKP